MLHPEILFAFYMVYAHQITTSHLIEGHHAHDKKYF